MMTTNPLEKITTLEEFIANPPQNMEWVDGQILAKNGMTLKHSKIQSRLDYSWRNYVISNHLGGETYVEAPCRTQKQVRRPDVSYLTPELLAEYGDFTTLPQSFPLVAEIASPTDLVEDFFAKAEEYLESGSLEVWLIIPQVNYIFVLGENQCIRFKSGEFVRTQKVLHGFSIGVAELLG